jgi:hypothetical protein
VVFFSLASLLALGGLLLLLLTRLRAIYPPTVRSKAYAASTRPACLWVISEWWVAYGGSASAQATTTSMLLLQDTCYWWVTQRTLAQQPTAGRPAASAQAGKQHYIQLFKFDLLGCPLLWRSGL